MLNKLVAIAIVGLLAIASSDANAIEKVTIGNAQIVVKTVTGTLEADRRQIQLQGLPVNKSIKKPQQSGA
jgi:hypothetical protein